MSEFKTGEIVWLRSGGPKMTVGAPRTDGTVNCTWFEGGKKMDEAFEEDQLTTEGPNPPLLPGRG